MNNLVDEEFKFVPGNIKRATNVLKGSEPDIRIGNNVKLPIYIPSLIIE